MALMVRRETKAMDNMADGTRSRFRTKSARARTDFVASDKRWRPASTSIPPLLVEVRGIGLDDLADQPVANHIHVREVVERDALDAGEDPLDLDES